MWTVVFPFVVRGVPLVSGDDLNYEIRELLLEPFDPML